MFTLNRLSGERNEGKTSMISRPPTIPNPSKPLAHLTGEAELLHITPLPLCSSCLIEHVYIHVSVISEQSPRNPKRKESWNGMVMKMESPLFTSSSTKMGRWSFGKRATTTCTPSLATVQKALSSAIRWKGTQRAIWVNPSRSSDTTDTMPNQSTKATWGTATWAGSFICWRTMRFSFTSVTALWFVCICLLITFSACLCCR